MQSFERQETPIVRITDSDGAVGVGYSYTIGTGGSAVARLLDEHLAPMLPGREAGDVEGLWRELMYRVHATTVGALTSIALAAIDTALWDLRARRAGLPLHRLAGGAKDRIPLYTTEGGWLHLPTEALVEGAVQARAEGFHGAKLKVGGPMWPRTWRASPPCARPWATTGTSWWTPTRAFGARGDPPRARLRASGHCLAGRADPRRRRARAPAAVGLDHGADRGGRVAVQPVAVQDYLQSDACSVVQVDVGRIGGITPWLKVAHMAEAYNVPVCPHFLMEIHVALCCAVPNSRWLEYIPQLDLITQSGMRIEDGHGVPSQAPGLGIDWDWRGSSGWRGTAAATADCAGQPAWSRTEGRARAAWHPTAGTLNGSGSGTRRGGRVVVEFAQHHGRDHGGVLFFHAAHHHAHMLGFQHHGHAGGVGHLLHGLGDLAAEVFLDLQAARVHFDDAGDLDRPSTLPLGR